MRAFLPRKAMTKLGDKVDYFSLQRSPHCAPSIVTRTCLCCYITFQCDIALDWKAIIWLYYAFNIVWLRREGRVCWIIFSPLFLRCQKVTVQHFDTSIQTRGWLKGSFSRHKRTFKIVIEPEWPLPGSTAVKICRKLVELCLTAGYPGTS